MSAVSLTLEVPKDSEAFFGMCKDIFSVDMGRLSPPPPPYNEVFVARVAKTADGHIAGGILAKVLWNCFEVLQLAVNPACTVPGAETLLLRWAEEAARGEQACNQMFLGVYSWQQPRAFYENLGYKLLWEHPNYPRGHSKCYMEKVWTMETRGEPVQGYDGADPAAVALTLEDWDAKEADAQLLEWAEAERKRCGVTDLAPCAKDVRMVQGLLPDGTLAACCLYSVTWNVLHVDILCVVTDGQRRGLGSAMLQKIDELARQHGCDDVYLETMSWQARPFYEKNGYTHVATQRDLPVHYHRYVMLHHLPQEVPSQL
jgi:GNAT superfamily N-acetyltransferase